MIKMVCVVCKTQYMKYVSLFTKDSGCVWGCSEANALQRQTVIIWHIWKFECSNIYVSAWFSFFFPSYIVKHVNCLWFSVVVGCWLCLVFISLYEVWKGKGYVIKFCGGAFLTYFNSWWCSVCVLVLKIVFDFLF